MSRRRAQQLAAKRTSVVTSDRAAISGRRSGGSVASASAGGRERTWQAPRGSHRAERQYTVAAAHTQPFMMVSHSAEM